MELLIAINTVLDTALNTMLISIKDFSITQFISESVIQLLTQFWTLIHWIWN